MTHTHTGTKSDNHARETGVGETSKERAKERVDRKELNETREGKFHSLEFPHSRCVCKSELWKSGRCKSQSRWVMRARTRERTRDRWSLEPIAFAVNWRCKMMRERLKSKLKNIVQTDRKKPQPVEVIPGRHFNFSFCWLTYSVIIEHIYIVAQRALVYSGTWPSCLSGRVGDCWAGEGRGGSGGLSSFCTASTVFMLRRLRHLYLCYVFFLFAHKTRALYSIF